MGNPMIDLSPWRNPDTGAFNLQPNFVGKENDNNILFTSVAVKFGFISEDEFLSILQKYIGNNGFILRYPGSSDYASYDDYVGAASASPKAASILLKALDSTGFVLPSNDWIGRFALMDCAVIAAAGCSFNPLQWAMCALTYWQNQEFDPKIETSGKQLLSLGYGVLWSRTWCLRPTVELWRSDMKPEYPGGLKDLMDGYYENPNHPFRVFARTDWNLRGSWAKT